MPLDAARMQSLSPCRVCNPDSALPAEEVAESPRAPSETQAVETTRPAQVVPAIIARARTDEDLSRAEREAFGQTALTAKLPAVDASDASNAERSAATLTTDDAGPAKASLFRRRRPRRR